MAVRLEVLGPAGGAPLGGACPSYVVFGARATVLLDCGPGAVERLWARGLLPRLDAVVISHPHMDHVLDLLPLSGSVVRPHLGDHRRPPLHVPRGAGEVLRALDRAFGGRSGAPTRFDAAFDVREYDARDRVEVGDLTLTFAPTEHAQPCFAARVTDGDGVLVYGADGGPSDAVAGLAEGADVLVLEATFLDDEATAAQYGHMTAGQAGALAARAGARRLLLTHLMPGADPDALARRAAEHFPGPVDVAREGLVVSVLT